MPADVGKGVEITATTPRNPEGLSITALYTSATWAWGKVPAAHLLISGDAQRVFRMTNLVLFFAQLFRRDLPPLRESLLQRHAAIDRLLTEEAPEVTLELASGFSPRGIARSAASAAPYVEIDLPAVIAQKQALLARSEAGRTALARPNLRLLAGDVATLDLEAVVRPLAKSGARLCVIAEGLLMYLPVAAQRALWQKIHRLFAGRRGLLVFDLVPAAEQPKPGWIGRLLAWLMKRFTKGQDFARDERTRDEVIADLRSAGFGDVEAIDTREKAQAWALPYPAAATRQLLFVCRP